MRVFFKVISILVISSALATLGHSKTDALDQTWEYKIEGLGEVEETVSAGSYGAVAFNQEYVYEGHDCSGRINVYDKDLNQQDSWSGYCPITMTATDEHLYVVDNDDETFKKLDAETGSEVWSISKSNGQQYNWMDKDTHGNLYIPDYGNDDYMKINSEGDIIWRISDGGSSDARMAGTDYYGEHVWFQGNQDIVRYVNSSGDQQCSRSDDFDYGNVDVIAEGPKEGYAVFGAFRNGGVKMVDTDCEIVWTENFGSNAGSVQVLDGAEQILASSDGNVKLLDFEGNIIESISTLHDQHSMRVDLGEEAIFTTPNTGSSMQKISINTTNIEDADLSICDQRGPMNECISNTSHNIGGQAFNISSEFESRSNAVFEAFNGPAILRLDNTTSISGLWRGQINIEAESPRLEVGAEFKPEGERIVIGN